MKITRNQSMQMPINPMAMFAVGGVPFVLPIAWIRTEARHTYNSVQQVDNPRWLPPISMSGNSLSITASVPTASKNKIASTSIALLKAYLTRNAELWASEKYENVDLETHRPAEIDAQGNAITANPDIGYYTAFGGVKLPWYLPMITGYIGAANYLLGGLVDQFSATYNPKTLMDEWTISIQAINISALRRDAPNPEAPEVNPETPSGKMIMGKRYDSVITQ